MRDVQNEEQDRQRTRDPTHHQKEDPKKVILPTKPLDLSNNQRLLPIERVHREVVVNRDRVRPRLQHRILRRLPPELPKLLERRNLHPINEPLVSLPTREHRLTQPLHVPAVNLARRLEQLPERLQRDILVKNLRKTAAKSESVIEHAVRNSPTRHENVPAVRLVVRVRENPWRAAVQVARLLVPAAGELAPALRGAVKEVVLVEVVDLVVDEDWAVLVFGDCELGGARLGAVLWVRDDLLVNPLALEEVNEADDKGNGGKDRVDDRGGARREERPTGRDLLLFEF